MAYPKLLLLLLFSTLLPPCTAHNLPPRPPPRKLQNGGSAKAQNPPPRPPSLKLQNKGGAKAQNPPPGPPPPGTSLTKGAPNPNKSPLNKKEQIVKILEAIIKHIQSVDKVELAEKILDVVLDEKVLEALGELLNGIPIAGAVIKSLMKFVFVLIPKKDPVLTTLRSGFKNIETRLNSMTKELKTETWLATYVTFEINIKNGWTKFLEYVNVSLTVDTEEAKMAEAKRFSEFYKNNIENSVLSLTQVLTVESDHSMSKNLVQTMVNQANGNVLTLKLYNNYIQGLLFQGVALDQAYHTIEKTNNDMLVRNAANSLYNVYMTMQKYEIECMEKYESNMKTDIENIVQTKADEGKDLTKQEARELATKIRDVLKEKYYWFDWGVVVYKNKACRTHILEGFQITAFENVNVAVVRMRTGERTTPKNIQIAVDNCIKPNHPCSDIIPALIKCSVQYVAVHISPVKNDSDNKKSKAEPTTNCEESEELFSALPTEHPEFLHEGACKRSTPFPLKGTFTVYMKSDHNINNYNPCSALKCTSGQGHCLRLPDTDTALCKCKHGYYGELCEKRFEDDIKNIEILENI